MKRRVYILAILLAAAMLARVEAVTIRDVFLSEPGDVFMLLDENARLDMLDYYDAGQHVSVTNNFRGENRLLEVKEDYIKVKTSEASEVEMLLIPSKKDTVVMVIGTLRLPARESVVRVFDSDWNELELGKYFKTPLIEDFVVIPRGEKKSKSEVTRMVDFPIVSYKIMAEEKTLVAKPELESYMSKEAYREIKPYLTDSLVYELKGMSFKLRKK